MVTYVTKPRQNRPSAAARGDLTGENVEAPYNYLEVPPRPHVAEQDVTDRSGEDAEVAALHGDLQVPPLPPVAEPECEDHTVGIVVPQPLCTSSSIHDLLVHLKEVDVIKSEKYHHISLNQKRVDRKCLLQDCLVSADTVAFVFDSRENMPLAQIRFTGDGPFRVTASPLHGREVQKRGLGKG